MEGGRSNLSAGEKPGHDGLRVLLNLAKFIGRDPPHLVMGRRGDGAEIFFRINTNKALKEGRYLLNLFLMNLLRKVSQIQPYMMCLMALVKKTSSFAELCDNCPGDEISGGEIFGRRRIALHKGLFILIPENSTLSPQGLTRQYAGADHTCRVELDCLEVHHGKACMKRQGQAIARISSAIAGNEIHFGITTGGHNSCLCEDGRKCTIWEPEDNCANTGVIFKEQFCCHTLTDKGDPMFQGFIPDGVHYALSRS
ncbi:hypothetical protein ES703_96458 [subsurface metagenome]